MQESDIIEVLSHALADFIQQ